MNRCTQKNKIIDKIKSTNNYDLLDKIEKELNEQPKYIKDFIIELFEKNYGDNIYGDVYCNNEVMYAFELTIRRIWIEIKDSLIPEGDNIDHWCELYVKRKPNQRSNKLYKEDLDIWISEQGYLFDSRELAWVIYNIWCEKVTFSQ